MYHSFKAPIPPFYIPDDLGFSWRWSEPLNAFFIRIPDGELIFSESFFTRKFSDRCVEYFQSYDNIDWQQDHIKMYGRQIPLPRLTAWFGDEGSDYSYSGIAMKANGWNKALLIIKHRIESVFKDQFNSVLLNWYRNGEDHQGWHADDEQELGENPVIASVNFGETRDFVLRRNDDKSKKLTIPLSHGSLLIMKGEVQSFWQHSVPKRKRVVGSRFNLTFRAIC